jgi:hypothetical protein
MVDLAATLTNTLSLLGTVSFVIIIAYLTVTFNYKKLASKNPWLPKLVAFTGEKLWKKAQSRRI